MIQGYAGFHLLGSSGLFPNRSGLVRVRACVALGLTIAVFRSTRSTGESATARQHRLHTADNGQQNGDSSSHGSHSGILSHESRRLLRHISCYRECPFVRMSRIWPLSLPSLKHWFCGQCSRKSRKYRSGEATSIKPSCSWSGGEVHAPAVTHEGRCGDFPELKHSNDPNTMSILPKQ